MSIQELGSIGELLAAIATILTLIYLAMQIRQGARATKAGIRQSMTDNQINYINARASDPTIRSAVLKMFNEQELTEEESTALFFHATAGMRMFENHFAQFTMGTMDTEEWESMRAVMKNHLRYDAYQRTVFSVPETWHPAFLQEVRNVLSEINQEEHDA